MAIKKVKFEIDQLYFMVEMTIQLDTDKFTEEVASCVNSFWGGAEDRIQENNGSVINAALKLYACEMFQQMAFNNFKNKRWLAEQFDWGKDKGIEGFYSLDEVGIEIVDADSWFIEADIIDLSFS